MTWISYIWTWRRSPETLMTWISYIWTWRRLSGILVTLGGHRDTENVKFFPSKYICPWRTSGLGLADLCMKSSIIYRRTLPTVEHSRTLHKVKPSFFVSSANRAAQLNSALSEALFIRELCKLWNTVELCIK
jgi:hypothetical protein